MALNLNFTLKALEMRGVLICFFGGRHLLGGIAGNLLLARRDEGKGALLWTTFASSNEVTQDFWGVSQIRYFQNSA